ncbi:hypothetical protein B0H63DRAFT_480813 [Podospora didyma]|uniref:Uncharacterized protein n=1 Tax=Podospora didyma TaxID=330526 RepID=A0AAE0KEJ7_9PEZI|nr:hypothetical protein B0H63DRAFT_480813 [Podospora didyma]
MCSETSISTGSTDETCTEKSTTRQSWSPTWITELPREVMADLRAVRWRRACLWALFSIWTSGLFLVTVALPLHAPNSRSACQPDGSFNLRPFDYQPWSSAGFFQITIAFGELTFTQAKVIDVIWDVVFGRVGQAILAFFSWKAFSMYSKAFMGTGSLTYDTFWAIIMQNGPSLRSTVHVIRDFATRKALQSKLAMAFIVSSMLFILGFPTLASSMSGYASNTGAFVADMEGTLVPFARFIPVAYVIHDGWRVNLTGDYIVPYVDSPVSRSGPIFGYNNRFYNNPYAYDSAFICNPTNMYPADLYSNDTNGKLAACNLSLGVSDYVRTYGFLSLNAEGKVNDIETSWMHQTIGPPALNISGHYFHEDNDLRNWFTERFGFFGHTWTDPRTGTRPYSNVSNLAFVEVGKNYTFTMDSILRSGSCQALLTYSWGFSYVQLWMMILALLAWTLGTYTLWLKAHLTLATRVDHDVPYRYKAALNLVSAMRGQLDASGETAAPGSWSSQQLTRYVDTHLRGGKITEESVLALGGNFSFRKGLWTWIKQHRKTSLMMAVLIPYDLLFWILILDRGPASEFLIAPMSAINLRAYHLVLVPLYLALLCWSIGFPLSMMVGSSKRTRWFFLFCTVVVVAGVPWIAVLFYF